MAALFYLDTLMHDDFPPLSPYATGLACKCPRCGQGKLYDGFIAVRSKCEACGLNLAFADAGDGPAVFVMMIAGGIVLGITLWIGATYDPPTWLLLMIMLPITLGVCLGLLRPLKSLLVSLQYRNKAEQGRLES